MSTSSATQTQTETQESISQWAEETFGLVGSNARVAARANEEMAELLRCLTSDDDSPKAAEEAADVLIVLYRLAARAGVRIKKHTVGRNYDRTKFVSNFSLAIRANNAMATLLETLAMEDEHERLDYFIDGVVLYLYCLEAAMYFDLDAAVGRKMATNRSREWNLDNTGHGYHVREARHA